MKTSLAWPLLALLSAAPAGAAAQVVVETITDLAVIEEPQGSGLIRITWTSPGVRLVQGGAFGPREDPVEYDFRIYRLAITEDTFEDAHRIIDEIPSPPSGVGVMEEAVVEGLKADKKYYFAVKAKGVIAGIVDWSPLSNVVLFDLDRTPPGPPEGFRVDDLAVTSGSIGLLWTVPDSDVVDIRICFGDGTPLGDWQSVLRERHTVADLVPSTSYRFSAQFRDGSLNVGPLCEPTAAVMTQAERGKRDAANQPCSAAGGGGAMPVAILFLIASALSAGRFRPDAQ